MTMNAIKTGFFLAIIFLSIASCKSKTEDKETHHETLAPNMIELSQSQYLTAGIQLGSPERRTLRKVLDVNGVVNVTPQDIASVSAPLGGFIKSTTLVQGSAVTKGQVLAQIENIAFIDLQQSYLETKAKHEYAAIEYKRHNELYKDNVYSENNVQQMESEYKTLNAQLKSLEQKLRILGIDPAQLKEDRIVNVLPIIAPISGYIKSVNINVGKYVGPTDVLFEIVNPDNLIIELVIFEKDVEKVEPGQKLTFSTPDHPENQYSATLYQAGKVLDNDKTSMAYARIDKPDRHLLSGMYVNAKIETESNAVISVPQQSVVQFNEKFYIFIFKGKRMENGKEINDFEALEVIKGVTEGGFSEITFASGAVPENLRIVITGAYSILSAWKNSGEMAC
jgi:membrane fusion protein, heavy metal efflux system